MKKKLIEVALPLDAINKESAREKSIRHGHPSTLHLWWARRPLATARAVLFASLVDDPSCDESLTPEQQDAERKRLFKIIEDLVVWENTNDEALFERAYQEILKSTDGNPPAVFDPFAGGGSIPLEAQRLGLKAIAADLNPVAVMINKAMIEIPAKFANRPPVNPEANSLIDTSKVYRGAQGLAEDIAYYGKQLKKLAYEKIGHLYPKVKVPVGVAVGENFSSLPPTHPAQKNFPGDQPSEIAHPSVSDVPNNSEFRIPNSELTVIAWLWARTVKCPNPACGCQMPLVNSFWLSKKAGKETYLEPIVEGSTIRYEVHHGKASKSGTVSRSGAICIACNSKVELKYIREEGKSGRLGAQMIAIVAEGKNGRVYLPPDEEHIHAAEVPKPQDYPDGEIPFAPRYLTTPAYGMENFADLFTNRQLTALTTFSDLISEVTSQIQDKEYTDAIVAYLAFLIDKLVDYHSTICGWHNSGEKIGHTFSRQAIPMKWDFTEANPFSNSSGCFDSMLTWIVESIQDMPAKIKGQVFQHNAQKDDDFRNAVVVSTDPPYYDNIGYANLSDFFYMWLRYSLKNIYPELFAKMQVPKSEELIAEPTRFENDEQKAKEYFEKSMAQVCKNLHSYSRADIPISIYYAFKQKDLDSDGEASSGWETMLTAIIKAGFEITGTWPMRTEMSSRTRAMDSNALASSIVLVCRKRKPNAGNCSQKNFRRELKDELQTALLEMQKANIAPVDMAQSAIGPGISVYSRYDNVLDAAGNTISVRDALKLINAELDEYFNGQGERLDAATQFCVDLYAQNAFNSIAFGQADVLARAKNISTDELAKISAIISNKGRVRLTDRDEMPIFIFDKEKRRHLNPEWLEALNESNCSWLWVQTLVETLSRLGQRGCALVLTKYDGSGEMLKDLAYRLYQISEKKKWAQEGTGYNNLIVCWSDIMEQYVSVRNTEQPSLF